jgi:hypothetical protein
LGDTGRKTGSWREEFGAPYFVVRDASLDLTVASPRVGEAPGNTVVPFSQQPSA